MKEEITSLASSITIKDSPFYKNEIIRPFIDAFFLNPDLVKNDKRCVLLNQYIFGEYEIGQLEGCLKYISRHVNIFIGYRFLSRKYRPFFLTLSKYDDTNFEITGYSTLMDDDLIERRYYQIYKVLPAFKNWNFKLSIAGDELKGVSRFRKSYSKWHTIRSIYESLEEIAKKTKRKNDKILEKMN
jgi:hypothetical protein